MVSQVLLIGKAVSYFYYYQEGVHACALPAHIFHIEIQKRLILETNVGT